MNKKNKTHCTVCKATPELFPDRDFIKDSQGFTLCDSCIKAYNLANTEIKKARDSQLNNNPTVQNHSNQEITKMPLPSPEEIYTHLSEMVIGQAEAKESLAIAVAHHYRRLRDPSIGKSNVLLIGPTGTGKTELGRSIAQYLKVPFISADATSFTTKGYVGEDADSVIQRLLAQCNWDTKLAETGIIFIDEVDKIARKGGGDGSTIGTVAVQQELLRLMEGDHVKINKPDLTNPTGFSPIYVDTHKILFICAGAFVGLEDIVVTGSSRTIGISESAIQKKDVPWGEKIETKHLTQYGMIPEFLGRLPIVTVTNKLSMDDLIRIMKEAKNSITKQYEALFKQDNAQITFGDDFYIAIANDAIKKELGARGLRQLIELRMKKLFFNISKYKDKHLTITADTFIVSDLKFSKKKLTTKENNK